MKQNIVISIIELIKGLCVTVKHLFVPSVTLQYPTQRCPVSERFRGAPTLIKDEQGKDRCVACCLCVAMCPSKAIKIIAGEGNNYQKEAMEFEINIARCIYCGLCVDACPKDAIHMSGEYELGCYDRDGMIYNKQILYDGPEIKKYK